MRYPILAVSLLSVCLIAARPVSGAESDSLLIIASEASEARVAQAATNLARHAEHLRSAASDRHVARSIQRLLPDTLLLPAAEPPAPRIRESGRGAVAEMLRIADETALLARFVREGSRRPAPAAPGTDPVASLSPGALISVDGRTGREQAHHMANLIQPFLLGGGTIARSSSETASNLLIAGGVVSAIVGFLTAPERQTPQELLQAQLRGFATADTAAAPGRAAGLVPARPGSLTGQANVDLAARELMLDEFHGTANRLLSSIADLRGQIRALEDDWSGPAADELEAARRTAEVAARLSATMERTEELAAGLDRFSREIAFVVDAYQRVDPRAAAQLGTLRNHSRMYTTAYEGEIEPALIARFPEARTALAHLQSAVLTIR